MADKGLKIKSIKTHVLNTPLKEKFTFSQGWIAERNSIIIELETESGIIGWDESFCYDQ